MIFTLFFSPLNVVLIVSMNKTVTSADVLIRGQDLKLNLSLSLLFSPLPSSAPTSANESLTSVSLTKLYQKTVCVSSRHVHILQICTSDSRTEK